MKVLFALLFIITSATGAECQGVIGIEQAINSAKQYVGTVNSTQLFQNRKTGECHYRVRGSEGVAIVDAKDGKLLRFHRKK